MINYQRTQSVAKIKKIINEFIELSIIPDISARPGLFETLRCSLNYREAKGLHFTGSDTKKLLRAAIAYHASKPADTFNIVASSRPSWPVPRRMSHHIGEFITAACPQQPMDYCPIIASALVMNAFHPGLHCE